MFIYYPAVRSSVQGMAERSFYKRRPSSWDSVDFLAEEIGKKQRGNKYFDRDNDSVLRLGWHKWMGYTGSSQRLG